MSALNLGYRVFAQRGGTGPAEDSLVLQTADNQARDTGAKQCGSDFMPAMNNSLPSG